MLSATVARRTGLVVALALGQAGCGTSGAKALSATSTNASVPDAASFVPGATANFAGAPANAGDWTQPGRDYANTRYSPLDLVTPQNVGELRIAWTFSDGTLHGHEAPPLVVNNTMFVVTPYPNIAYALDLTKVGWPIKWKFEPHPAPVAIGKACCDVVNRGVAYADGKLVYNLLDAHTVAVDATTGQELWRTKLANVEDGITMTMAPLIVDGRVYVGNSGGEMGVPGWLTALDLNSGAVLWRAYAIGPDSMTRIGADYKPFYPWLSGRDLGTTTWPADAWRHGAGAAWGWVSYDPELNLIYYGTSNPGPRVPVQRPGLNLFTSAVFARDAATGMARWAYQFTPHDEWDYDGVNENVLATLPIGGVPRKVLVHFDRNGYGYTIDRTTGEVLVAKPFAHLNWSTGFDMASGKPIVNPAMEPKPGVTLHDLCPPDIGAKDWQPASFSPRTGLFYTQVQNICMDLTDHEVSYIAGTPYDGMQMDRRAGPGDYWGGLIAWDATTGRRVWSVDERFMTISGVLTTASDLVFYGTVDGWFRAVHARTGAVLWSHRVGSGITSPPMTFLGPDGRQYVAVYAGVGGAAMVSASMKGFPPRGGTLYVFSIGGDSPNIGTRMLVTEAGAAAASPDETQSGRR